MNDTCAHCEWWDAPPNPTRAGDVSPAMRGYCVKQKPGEHVVARDYYCEKFSAGLWIERHSKERIRKRAEAAGGK